ncbi:hypothetical protein [Pseudanabaena sp. FACHB-2040]|uniref:hypothetical protein n=1 Tax=Pseudanabaena sp. FACHB-2040 TaxID=2692859 RepID=UPI001683F541|nr:hypothetical protein [Pseudanabaena sp. FACHB-2040]MBD2261362.1 hypothetical protein [Pseudanabaena sp. FACHB-2040]
MPWTPTTKARIMAALRLPQAAPRWWELVEDAMTRVEMLSGGSSIGYVEGLLTSIEAAKTAIASGAGDSALVRADVLEWQPGQRNAGFSQELAGKKEDLICALFTEPEQVQIRRIASGSGNRVRIRR